MLINLETLELEEIKCLLKSESISFEVDKEENKISLKLDGDAEDFLDVFVEVDRDKGALRIYGITLLFSDEVKRATKEQILETINFMNIGSNTIKYAVIGKRCLTFEYGMLLSGEVSSNFIIKTIESIKDDVSVLDSVFRQVFELVNRKKEK